MVAAVEYFPDPDFDPYEFERFYHSPWRYQADESLKSESTIAQDYVPEYAWLRSLGRDVVDRFLSKPTLPPVLHLVPLLPPSPVSEESDYVYNCALKLAQAKRCLIEAQEEIGELSYEELKPFIDALYEALKAFDNAARLKHRQRIRQKVMGKVIQLFGLKNDD